MCSTFYILSMTLKSLCIILYLLKIWNNRIIFERCLASKMAKLSFIAAIERCGESSGIWHHLWLSFPAESNWKGSVTEDIMVSQFFFLLLQAGNVPLRNFKSNACLLEEEDSGRKLFSNNKPGRKGSLAWEIKEVPVKGGGHRLPETGEVSPIKTWICFMMETQGN